MSGETGKDSFVRTWWDVFKSEILKDRLLVAMTVLGGFIVLFAVMSVPMWIGSWLTTNSPWAWMMDGSQIPERAGWIAGLSLIPYWAALYTTIEAWSRYSGDSDE